MSHTEFIAAAKEWVALFGDSFTNVKNVTEDASDIFQDIFEQCYSSDEDTPYQAYDINSSFYILIMKCNEFGYAYWKVVIAEDYYVIVHDISFTRRCEMISFIQNLGISIQTTDIQNLR